MTNKSAILELTFDLHPTHDINAVASLIMAITDLDRELEWFETMPVNGWARTVRTACKIGDHVRKVDIIRNPEDRRVTVNLHLVNLADQFWKAVAGRIVADMEEHGKFCFINGSDE